MQTILSFQQSKNIIERRAKKGLHLSIAKQNSAKSFHVKGQVKKLKVSTYTIKVNKRLVYELPGDHIPYEFLKSGWVSDDIELLLSQVALHLDNGSSAKMTFALDEQAIFRSKTGKIEKTLLVNFNLAGLLYKYVRLGEKSQYLNMPLTK